MTLISKNIYKDKLPYNLCRYKNIYIDDRKDIYCKRCKPDETNVNTNVSKM